MNMNHHFPDLGGRGSCSDYFHKSLYVCLFMVSKRETFFFFYFYTCCTGTAVLPRGHFCLFFNSFQRYWIVSYIAIASPFLYFMLFQLTVHKRISPTFQDFAQDSSAHKWTFLIFYFLFPDHQIMEEIGGWAKDNSAAFQDADL